MKSSKRALAIGLICTLFFQVPVLTAADATGANDPIAGGGPHQPPLPTRPADTGPIAPGKQPGPIEVLPILIPEDEKPLKPPTISPIEPPPPVLPRPIRPTPLPIPKEVIPKLPKPPEVPTKVEELTRQEVFQIAAKAKRKKKREAKPAANIKFSRDKNYRVKLTDLRILGTTSDTADFLASLAGLDPNVEVNALLRSSADSAEIADRHIVGMNCKGNACTARAQGLDPDVEYMISLLIKDASQEAFIELVSKNIEQRTFTTLPLRAEETLAKVRQIFLKEAPGEQAIDESSIEISGLQSDTCTAVAVCPKQRYNVAAKSKDGSGRVVATVALFDGKGDRYVSDFRIQRKTSLSAPVPRIV